MKTYIIGRQEDCDIVIIDPTQMVSRHHAVLTVNGSKMTITDQSANGTYINGIRIAAGAPVPVTRKDVVSLAQAAELNWARIPDPSRKTLGWIAGAAVALLLLCVGGKFAYDAHQERVDLDNKEFVKDTTELARLNKVVEMLAKDYELINVQSDSLGKVFTGAQATIEKKVPGKDLNKVIKDVAQIETLLQTIKVDELHEKIFTLKATVGYENNPAELAKKVKPVQEQTDLYKQSLKTVAARLSDVEKNLKDIPNKPSGKQKNDKDKEKEKESDPIIMSPETGIL